MPAGGGAAAAAAGSQPSACRSGIRPHKSHGRIWCCGQGIGRPAAKQRVQSPTLACQPCRVPASPTLLKTLYGVISAACKRLHSLVTPSWKRIALVVSHAAANSCCSCRSRCQTDIGTLLHRLNTSPAPPARSGHCHPLRSRRQRLAGCRK